MKDDSGETLRVEIVAVNRMARFLMTIFVLLPKNLGWQQCDTDLEHEVDTAWTCHDMSHKLPTHGLWFAEQCSHSKAVYLWFHDFSTFDMLLECNTWIWPLNIDGPKLFDPIMNLDVWLRIIVAMLLTYIGCRWLAATQSFGDLILNALALEFATWQTCTIQESTISDSAPKVLRRIIL